MNQDTIKESNASSKVSLRCVLLLTAHSFSILSSLTTFGDEVNISNGDNERQSQIFSRRNFALQVQEVDPNEFAGESFNVDLGSVEEAMNLSQIYPSNIQTSASSLSNATGSLSVDENILKNINSNKVRLGYTVFVLQFFVFLQHRTIQQ